MAKQYWIVVYTAKAPHTILVLGMGGKQRKDGAEPFPFTTHYGHDREKAASHCAELWKHSYYKWAFRVTEFPEQFPETAPNKWPKYKMKKNP
jgi:hypothetical protein